jgi:hypothetical protein
MTKHKKASWRKGKEFVKKVFINCKQCNNIIKCYPSEIKQFCNRKCCNIYRIGKKRIEHSIIMKEKHKIKSFGYKKGEQIGDNNPAKRLDVRKKISDKAKGKNNYFYNKHFIKELNSMWKGGISFEPYGFEFNEKLKKVIRDRDNYTCIICKKKGNTIHHIDYNKKNNNPNNLICLCNSCHGKTTKNRNNWTKYFKRMINGK